MIPNRIVSVRSNHRDLRIAEKLSWLSAWAYIQTAINWPKRLLSCFGFRETAEAFFAFTVGQPPTFLHSRLILAFASSCTCKSDLTTTSDLKQALVILPNHCCLILSMTWSLLCLESLINQSIGAAINLRTLLIQSAEQLLLRRFLLNSFDVATALRKCFLFFLIWDRFCIQVLWWDSNIDDHRSATLGLR